MSQVELTRDLRIANDVAPNNMGQRPRRSGILTYLTDTVPEDHKATIKAIEDARAKLSELEVHRAFLERVAHAAGVALPGATDE